MAAKSTHKLLNCTCDVIIRTIKLMPCSHTPMEDITLSTLTPHHPLQGQIETSYVILDHESLQTTLDNSSV